MIVIVRARVDLTVLMFSRRPLSNPEHVPDLESRGTERGPAGDLVLFVPYAKCGIRQTGAFFPIPRRRETLKNKIGALPQASFLPREESSDQFFFGNPALQI